MIFIVVKFDVAEEHRESWPAITEEFTKATRAEEGNLWFDWSRSLDNPSEYVLVEAFRDQQAGVEHVKSDHFNAGLAAMRPVLRTTPRIVHADIPADGWSKMGELAID